jgi:hypothetical protein
MRPRHSAALLPFALFALMAASQASAQLRKHPAPNYKPAYDGDSDGGDPNPRSGHRRTPLYPLRSLPKSKVKMSTSLITHKPDRGRQRLTVPAAAQGVTPPSSRSRLVRRRNSRTPSSVGRWAAAPARWSVRRCRAAAPAERWRARRSARRPAP